MLKIALGILFILHGLVHVALAAAPDPGDDETKPGAFFTAVDRSWLLLQLGLSAAAIRWTGLILVALSTVGFVLAGLGILGLPGLSAIWRSAAVVSSCLSLLLLIIFWHPWLIVGVLIDVSILFALLWAQWPPAELMGA